MDLKRLRLRSIDDPALITAIQAAVAKADSPAQLEALLSSRGWAVGVIELDERTSVGQTVLEVRRLDPASSTKA
jgi:hypothetical protein